MPVAAEQVGTAAQQDRVVPGEPAESILIILPHATPFWGSTMSPLHTDARAARLHGDQSTPSMTSVDLTIVVTSRPPEHVSVEGVSPTARPAWRWDWCRACPMAGWDHQARRGTEHRQLGMLGEPRASRGGHECQKPRKIPSSSTELVKSGQSIFAMLMLFSTLHIAAGTTRNGS